MASQKIIQQFNLQVKTELEALREVLEWFEGMITPAYYQINAAGNVK